MRRLTLHAGGFGETTCRVDSPPGSDGDGHLTVLGEGNACSRVTIGLQEGEDGVKVITRRHSVRLHQELADILEGKDHARPGFDSHSVGVATNIRAQGEGG